MSAEIKPFTPVTCSPEKVTVFAPKNASTPEKTIIGTKIAELESITSLKSEPAFIRRSRIFLISEVNDEVSFMRMPRIDGQGGRDKNRRKRE